jgi:hypothetical protein
MFPEDEMLPHLSLDEFAAVTGFHRKDAIRLLRAGQVIRSCGLRPGRRVYDDAMRVDAEPLGDPRQQRRRAPRGATAENQPLAEPLRAWLEKTLAQE